MQIVIDGYNYIKSYYHVRTVSEKKRSEYIAKLISQAQKKRHQLIIVFDGGEFNFPTKEYRKGHIIMYSGYRESADDVIKNYVADHRNQDILVVTSDRELRNFIKNLGVETVGIMKFNELFMQAEPCQPDLQLTVDAVPIKTSVDSDPLVDQLMQQLSQEVIEKKGEDKKKRQSHSHQLSKKERIKNRKLNKL